MVRFTTGSSAGRWPLGAARQCCVPKILAPAAVRLGSEPAPAPVAPARRRTTAGCRWAQDMCLGRRAVDTHLCTRFNPLLLGVAQQHAG